MQRTYLILILALTMFALSGGFNTAKAGAMSCTGCNNQIVCEGTCNADFFGPCFWDVDSCKDGSPPVPIFFDDCMFTDNGSNTYECFCSGDGKNFFKIECTQAEFDFCKNDVLGEVKRLLVVDTIDNPPPPGGSYSFDLECASIAGGA